MARNLPTDDRNPNPPDEAGRRRLRGFLNHLVTYFAVMVLVVPLNAWLAPDEPWFLLPLVGWGAPLALHAAHAMGLFRRG